MWKPKCCNTSQVQSIDTKLTRPVDLYIKELKSYTTPAGEQKSTYSAGTLVARKMCHMKDRSTASQETSILNSKTDPSTAKELIFKYFNLDSIKINEIRWEGVTMNILGISKISSTTINRVRYNAPNGLPFISIIVGVNKL